MNRIRLLTTLRIYICFDKHAIHRGFRDLALDLRVGVGVGVVCLIVDEVVVAFAVALRNNVADLAACG